MGASSRLASEGQELAPMGRSYLIEIHMAAARASRIRPTGMRRCARPKRDIP